MPRNRQKRKQSGKFQQVQAAPVQASPAAIALMDRITSGGPEYLRDNAERVLIESAELAGEPEFADLSFNSQKAAEVTERWYQKYEKRLNEAEKKSQDDFDMVFDDMRIDVIDELLNPAFRKQVRDRLDAAYNRYLAADDLKKLETLFLLRSLLSIKDIPWGVCGLMIEIYNRAIEPAMEAAREENELAEEMAKALQENFNVEEEELAELFQNPEPSEQFEQIGQKIMEENPALLERVEEHAWKIIESFEDELFKGKIDLKLFTESELSLPFERLNQETGKNFDEMEPDEETTKKLFETVEKTLNEIMTPERYRQLIKTVESTIRTWQRQRNKWAQALQFELIFSEKEKYEETKFILAAYFGQLNRAGKSKNRKR